MANFPVGLEGSITSTIRGLFQRRLDNLTFPYILPEVIADHLYPQSMLVPMRQARVDFPELFYHRRVVRMAARNLDRSVPGCAFLSMHLVHEGWEIPETFTAGRDHYPLGHHTNPCPVGYLVNQEVLYQIDDWATRWWRMHTENELIYKTLERILRIITTPLQFAWVWPELLGSLHFEPFVSMRGTVRRPNVYIRQLRDDKTVAIMAAATDLLPVVTMMPAAPKTNPPIYPATVLRAFD